MKKNVQEWLAERNAKLNALLMEKAVKAAERNLASGLWKHETAQLYLTNKAEELFPRPQEDIDWEDKHNYEACR